MYNAFAEYYDTIFPLSPAALKLIRESCPSDPRVLELGCGTGALLKALNIGGNATGLDIEPALIAKAQASAGEEIFRCEDLLSYAKVIDDEHFDLIFSLGNVVSHLSAEHFKAWIGAIHRLLKPGGQWIFHVIHWDDILNGGEYVYPALARGEYSFHRTYKNSSAQKLDFVTSLCLQGDVIFEQVQLLYPHNQAFIENLHQDFVLKSIWGDYGKSEAKGISRVYCYTKPL